MRNNLLGLPLDLAALNIARGRDTGIPSLNEARAQLYDDTGLADLKPYDELARLRAEHQEPDVDHQLHRGVRHAQHASPPTTTLAGKRAAAESLVFGGVGAPADRLDFLNATGAYAGRTSGGLNESTSGSAAWPRAMPEFGGMLGSTFNFIFEVPDGAPAERRPASTT